jgi:hypothetical protein
MTTTTTDKTDPRIDKARKMFAERWILALCYGTQAPLTLTDHDSGWRDIERHAGKRRALLKVLVEMGYIWRNGDKDQITDKGFAESFLDSGSVDFSHFVPEGKSVWEYEHEVRPGSFFDSDGLPLGVRCFIAAHHDRFQFFDWDPYTKRGTPIAFGSFAKKESSHSILVADAAYTAKLTAEKDAAQFREVSGANLAHGMVKMGYAEEATKHVFRNGKHDGPFGVLRFGTDPKQWQAESAARQEKIRKEIVALAEELTALEYAENKMLLAAGVEKTLSQGVTEEDRTKAWGIFLADYEREVREQIAKQKAFEAQQAAAGSIDEGCVDASRRREQ